MKRAAGVVLGIALLGAGTLGTAGVASAAHTPKPKLPSIKDISPENGPLGGGTTVDVFGKNLGGVTGVAFGGTPASSFRQVNSGEVQAVSPAGTGTVDVAVSTTAGTTAPVATDEFNYVSGPTIQSLYLKSGTTLGGAHVTISGVDFTSASAVMFGAVPAASFVVESDSAILAITPAESAGTVNVSVTTPDGTTPVDPAAAYTFSLKVPVITSVAPDSGPDVGGNTVTITGKIFKDVSAVDFGANPATSYIVNSVKSITAVVPPGATGNVDVSVTNASGQSAIVEPVDIYTYTG